MSFSPSSMFGNFLCLLILCPLIAASGHDAYVGIVGCLASVVLVIGIPGLASFHLERCLGAYPVDFAGAWTPPDYWDAADIALEMPEHADIWTDGSTEDFSSIGGFEVAGVGVYLPASELAF